MSNCDRVPLDQIGWQSSVRGIFDCNRLPTLQAVPTYGINASGMMPVLSITGNSNGSSNNMSIEASIQIEREDGKRYTRQMKDSELSIQ